MINYSCAFFIKITGASLGIGKCIAIEAAKRGAHVTLVARNALNLDKAASEVRQAAKEPSQKVQCLSSMYALQNELLIKETCMYMYHII